MNHLHEISTSYNPIHLLPISPTIQHSRTRITSGYSQVQVQEAAGHPRREIAWSARTVMCLSTQLSFDYSTVFTSSVIAGSSVCDHGCAAGAGARFGGMSTSHSHD